ncbi:MAG: peptidylprolyl isomerase [Pseudomonadota bacterium]
MNKIKNLCAAGALCFAPLCVADELSTTGDFLDGVAAVVNDGVVLKSKLRTQIAQIIRQAESQAQPIPLPPADVLQEQVLERLVVDEVQLQRARRIGLQIPDQALNEALSRIAAQQNPPVPFEQLPAVIEANGMAWPVFREQLRDELTLDQLRRIDVGQRIQVAPREIRQCINDLESDVVGNSAYNLSHIIVSVEGEAGASDIIVAEDKIKDIYRQIEEGADFREMAIAYSEGPTALEGGALGWREGARVPSLFTEVLPALKKGEVSEPFRWGNSFHLVKVNDLRSALQRSEINQVKARHILITPNEIIDDATAQQRLNDAIERINNGEDFGEVAKLLSDDPGSANDGGDLGWAGPGTFVGAFETAIDALEIGEMSSVPFKSQFGWHVVEVLDRRVYDNTEELKERNCVGRIRESKLQDETQLWIRRLRDEAFVDKRI